MTDEIEAIQKRGAAARAIGISQFSNPFFRPEAMPIQTGERAEDWGRKAEAWTFGWKMEDANRRTSMTDTIEAVARAICEASGDTWRTNEGLTPHAIAIIDREASNNHWRYKAQAAIASHTKALIEQAGELAAQVIDRTIARLRGLHDYAARPAWDAIVAEELAATIAALRAENERAKEEGVRAGIEAAVGIADHLGGDRVERKDDGSLRSYDMDSKHGRGDATLNSMRVRAQTIATAIRALNAAAIAKGV